MSVASNGVCDLTLLHQFILIVPSFWTNFLNSCLFFAIRDIASYFFLGSRRIAGTGAKLVDVLRRKAVLKRAEPGRSSGSSRRRKAGAITLGGRAAYRRHQELLQAIFIAIFAANFPSEVVRSWSDRHPQAFAWGAALLDVAR